VADAVPFSIKIFLADGTPDGLRVVEKTNWTGVAYCFARTGFAAVRAGDDLARPGVYVLTGPPESEGYRQRIYIGEADDLGARIRKHAIEREFWRQAVAFTSKDDDLNKAHVRYLEAELLRLARASGRAELDNSVAFLADMLLIYPIVGVEAFEALDAQVAPSSPRLYLKGESTSAEGRETAEGLLVFAGATARATVAPSLRDGRQRQRDRLIAEGVFEPHDDVLRLTRDYLFTAPSAAATILLGRSANGRVLWKDDTGRTLAEIQDAALSDPGDLG
jgi:hypothetical protein